jgi:hypothetical protein
MTSPVIYVPKDMTPSGLWLPPGASTAPSPPANDIHQPMLINRAARRRLSKQIKKQLGG